MKYLPLVWAALRRKPARTLLTCFSIMTGVFSVGHAAGINVGIAKIMQITSVRILIVMSRVNQGAPMPLAQPRRSARYPASRRSAVHVVNPGLISGPTIP